MIEMLGVLAIIGVLSAGGIWGYTLAMENYRINKFIEDIQTMASGVAPYFANPNRTSNLSLDDLHTLGIVPDSYYKTKEGTCSRENGYHCSVQAPTKNTIYIYAYGNGSNKRFTLYISNPASPKKLCTQIYTHNWGSYNGKVYISALSVSASGIETAPPVSTSTAETICNAIEGGKHYILLKFQQK